VDDHPEWTMPVDRSSQRVVLAWSEVRIHDRRSLELLPTGRDEIMSTGIGPDDEFAGSAQDEDLATRFTRGVVDGFTEASQAFSHELEGTNRFPELMSRSVAGMIRANARLLDEVATVVRHASDGLGERPRRRAEDEFDYERLADLVAARLGSAAPEPRAGQRRSPRSSPSSE
jgi:hypothetical protein